MITEKLIEFNNELIEEVKNNTQSNNMSTLSSFKSIFVSYLIEAGETTVADIEIIDFKKASDKMRLDGYVYNEYFHSLTLLISDFSSNINLEKMGKTEIDKLTKQVIKFFKACKGDYFKQLEESSLGYQAYEYINLYIDEIETVNLILITNKEAVIYIPDDLHIGKTTIKCDVWDIERLYRCVFQNGQAEQLVIKLRKKYNTKLPLIKVLDENKTYDCYIGVITGELLAKIYKDEGHKLIEKNVRSFLQATGKINKGIKDTLKSSPEMFMAYNNGISTVADEIIIDSDESGEIITIINEIHGWQIVNGGQTTASIYNAYQNKMDLSSINVQMKLTVVKDKAQVNEIVSSISKYANSQNKINMSDFSANDEYHIKMERLSRITYIPVERGKSLDRWFYERARGQYLVELNRQTTTVLKKQFKQYNPKSRCISKTVAAKCIMSWMGYPNIVSKGLETNFIDFSEQIKSNKIDNPTEESYIKMICKVILFNETDKIIANNKFGGFKAQQNYYTVALIGKYFNEKVDDKYIWKNQTINPELSLLIEDLIYKVWNHFMQPTIPGVNIGQWCKKEDCWELLQKRFDNNEL